MGTGRAIVAASGAASLAIGAAAASPPLLTTLGGSLALGIAYSTDLPFLRWKRSPVLAACCILAVRWGWPRPGTWGLQQGQAAWAPAHTLLWPGASRGAGGQCGGRPSGCRAPRCRTRWVMPAAGAGTT